MNDRCVNEQLHNDRFDNKNIKKSVARITAVFSYYHMIGSIGSPVNDVEFR